MGDTFADGFRLLGELAPGFFRVVEADLEAAADPEGLVGDHLVAAPARTAASMPLCMQLQLETLAAAAEWSVARVCARAFLTTAVRHSIRLNDALDAKVFLEGRRGG